MIKGYLVQRIPTPTRIYHTADKNGRVILCGCDRKFALQRKLGCGRWTRWKIPRQRKGSMDFCPWRPCALHALPKWVEIE